VAWVSRPDVLIELCSDSLLGTEEVFSIHAEVSEGLLSEEIEASVCRADVLAEEKVVGLWQGMA